MTSDMKLLPLPEPAISERGTGMGRHDVYHVPRWFTPEQMQAYARACIEAATALEAAREDAKDAERYRWLRSLTHENAEVIGRWGAGCGHDPAWLDAAIDAARKEAP